MRHGGFAFVALFILALAACNGGPGGPAIVGVPGTPLPTVAPTTTPPAAPGSATVSFAIVVPAAGSSRTRPHVVVPSNATSVTFTIDSVNGTSYSGTPTTEKLSTTNSACQSVSGQLSCVFNLPAPVGALIYTVTVYNGTTVISEGNVSLTTTNGATVSAPLTLSGTVTKIVVAVGNGVLGVAASAPVTVEAKDANGNIILGTYTSPITLTDTDASGNTTIATSGSDSPSAGELLSSGDTATLTYNGGAMPSAATIGASASGVSASNVTPATFLPAANYLDTSGSTTYLGVTYESSSSGQDGTPPPPTPGPTSTTFPIAIATGQSYGAATNLIGVTGLPSSPGGNPLTPLATTYYSWSAGANGAVLGLVGWSEPTPISSNLANPYYYHALYTPQQTLQSTCAPPYPELLVVPLPASWNVYRGAGPCTTVFMDNLGGGDSYVYNSDGSYTDSYSGDGSIMLLGAATISVSAAGYLRYNMTGPYGSGTMIVPAPSPNASTVPVTFATPCATCGDIFFPTPAPSSAPNPWLAIGLPHGVPPNPLFSDTFTNVGPISSLPPACAVPAGLVPASNPPLSEADESVVAADPMDDWLPLYSTMTIKHYYLNGVGEVCNENQYYEASFADDNDEIPSQPGTIDSYNFYAGSAVAWYAGVNQNWVSYESDTYTYITATTLTAVQARVRDFTKVLPAATQALTAASYHLARTELQPPRRTLAHPLARSFHR